MADLRDLGGTSPNTCICQTTIGYYDDNVNTLCLSCHTTCITCTTSGSNQC